MSESELRWIHLVSFRFHKCQPQDLLIQNPHLKVHLNALETIVPGCSIGSRGQPIRAQLIFILWTYIVLPYSRWASQTWHWKWIKMKSCDHSSTDSTLTLNTHRSITAHPADPDRQESVQTLSFLFYTIYCFLQSRKSGKPKLSMWGRDETWPKWKKLSRKLQQ